MKNKVLVSAVLVSLLAVGLVFLSCDTGGGGSSSSGNVTITGLEDFNGKYVLGFGENTSGTEYEACNGYSKDSIKCVKVSGGKAVFRVYQSNNSGPSTEFKGNDTIAFDIITTDSKSSVKESDMFSLMQAMFGGSAKTVTVALVGGIGSGVAVPSVGPGGSD